MYSSVLYFLYLAFFWICPQDATSGQPCAVLFKVAFTPIS